MHPPQRHRALSHSGRGPRVVRGYVLLPVVLTMTLVAAIAYLINIESAINVDMSARQFEGTQARYITEAGLNHALWQTRRAGCGPYSDNTNLSFGNGSYTTTLTTDLGSTNSYTLSVDQDAWVRSDQPTNNMGSDTKLHIRYEGGIIERPMYRYDVSSIAANASILSATAWFYVSKEHPQGPVRVHRLIADWTETDATWDTMGDKMNAVPLATIPTQPVAGVWVSINLTAQVQAWVNGQANYGITLNSTSEGTHGDYASREAAQQPYLEVIVATPPSSPATLQSVGTLANGVSRTITRNNVTLYQFPPGILELQPDAVDGIDAQLKLKNPDYNYGTDNELEVQEGANKDEHSVIWFTMGIIPIGAKIENATLNLYQFDSTKPASEVGVHRLTDYWTEGTNDALPGTGVTWNDQADSDSWSSPGGDFDNTLITTTSIPANTAGHFEWDVTELVQGWVSGTYPNYGLILTPESTGTDVRFRSSDRGTASERPKLTVTYRCQCGVPCFAPQGTGRIALIGDDSTPDSDDQLKIEIIESWGYEVDFYEDLDSGSINWSNYDLAYVSETVISGAINTNLTNLSIGVVNEEPLLYPDMAQGNGFSTKVDSSIDISDNSHYITAPFALGALPIYAGGMEIMTLTTPLPTGTQVLAENGGDSVVTVLDLGAINNWGNPSPGRRVTLPLGRHFASDFNWAHLNNNGRLLVQRALQWASGNLDPIVSDPIILSTDSDATLGGLSFQDTDLIEYDLQTDSATLFLDSAALGMSQKIDAVHVLANGHIVLSTRVDTSFAGLSFTKEDLIEYDPVADVATMYLDADVHFQDQENIISVYVRDNGNIVLSTDTTATLGGVTFSDLDLVEYDPSTGNASIFFDGDATTLSQEIRAVHLLKNGHIVMAADADTTLGGLSFGADQLIEYDPVADTATMYFNGKSAFSTTTEKIRSLHIGSGSGGDTVSGPIAHWKLDETSGTTAVDSEGGHDGTLSNGPAWNTGKLDGALDFDGSDDLVDMGSDATLDDVFAGGATVSAWIYPEGWGESDFGRILDKADNLGSNRNGWAYELYGSNQSILFQYGFSSNIGNWVTPANSISLNIWQHVAVVYDNSLDANDPVLYINGVAQTVTEIDTPSGTPSSDAALNLTLGNYSFATSRTFDGRLDDVRIYDRMLGAAEIAELFNAGKVGLVAHWKLDETSGTIAVDSEGGHDGTLNGPSWTGGQIDGGLNFDASNDRVNVPHDDSLSLKDAFTLSAWINSESLSGYDLLLNKGMSGNNQNYWLGTLDDEITFGFYTDTWREFNTSSVNLQQNTWYHIAATFDDASDQVRLYLDGSEVLSTSTIYSPTPNTEDLQIGGSQHGEDWRGKVDDIRIYDTVLSAAEVADLATGGGGGGGSPPAVPVFEEFTEAALGSNDTSLTISKPPGTAEGDLLIAAVATDGGNKSSLAPPAGWNIINVDDRGGKVTFGVWWKLAGASENNSYTFNWSDNEQAYGWIMRFTGHDSASPIAEDSKDEGKSASPSSPSVTTAVNNTLILRLGGFDDDDITAGDPGLSGHTAINMGDSGSGDKTASGGSGYVLQAAAGASGTSSFALTGNNEEYVTVTIAIAPVQ